MILTILYDRLFSDGSLMEIDSFQYKNEDFDLSIIPDIIAKFYKENVTYNVKITNIIIDRKGYEDTCLYPFIK